MVRRSFFQTAIALFFGFEKTETLEQPTISLPGRYIVQRRWAVIQRAIETFFIECENKNIDLNKAKIELKIIDRE